MVRVKCPRCSHLYQLQPAMAGKKVRCKQPDCGALFRVPGQPHSQRDENWDEVDSASQPTPTRTSSKKKIKPASKVSIGSYLGFGASAMGLIAFTWIIGHFVFTPPSPENLTVSAPNPPAVAESTPLKTKNSSTPPVEASPAESPPLQTDPASPAQASPELQTPPPPVAETVEPEPVEEVVPEPVAPTPPPLPVGPPLPKITIDGKFEDWAEITSYTDPPHDTHDVDTRGRENTPKPVDNPDADLLEYKVMHDEENLYAYFRARGRIGRTQKETEEHKRNARKLEAIKNSGRKSPLSQSRQRDLEKKGQPGRYYAILTIDVDQDDTTGYWLDEGGYYPFTPGYDVNAELEWFDGQINTGHYLNHGARDESELLAAFMDQTQGKYIKDNDGPYPAGTLTIKPGTYKYYTQWVYHEDDTITIVRDKGPAIPGIVRFALSDDQHELEAQFPYKGFLKDNTGKPIIGLGQTLDISFSLEASGEFAKSHEWASDTGDPIEKYTLTPPPESSAASPQ